MVKWGAAAEEAVPILTMFLHDESSVVRNTLYGVLGDLGLVAMDAVPALGSALLKTESWSEKEVILNVLVKIAGADQEAIPPLRSTLVTCYGYGWLGYGYWRLYDRMTHAVGKQRQLCGRTNCRYLYFIWDEVVEAIQKIKESPRPVKVKPWKETL